MSSITANVTAPTHQMIMDVVSERYGTPEFCYFYGSHAFGRGEESSDVDVIIVLSRVVHPYRESFTANGFLFDAQIHDPETLHFMLNFELKEGFAGLATILDQALVLPAPSPVADRLKEIARRILAAGPPPVAWLVPRRYITSMLSDLKKCTDPDDRRMVVMDLYVTVLTLFLRRNGQFPDRGRYLLRSVKRVDPALYERARNAVTIALEGGSISPLVQFAHEVLDTVGGPLETGYRQNYPEKYRLPLPPSPSGVPGS